jgi:DNA primase
MNYQDNLRELKKKISIEKLIGNKIKLERYAKTCSGPCPFHNQEYGKSLIVDLVQKNWRCYVCHIGGDSIDFTMRYYKMDYIESVLWLGRKAGINVEMIFEHRKKMEALNNLKRILQSPVLIMFKSVLVLLLPFVTLVGFFMTNWEKEDEVQHFKDVISKIIKYKIL